MVVCLHISMTRRYLALAPHSFISSFLSHVIVSLITSMAPSFRKNYRFRLSKNRIDGDYIINYRGRALLKVCSRSNCLSLAFLTKLTKAAPLLPVPVMSSPGTPSTSTSQLRHRLPPQPQSPEQSVYDIQQVQDDEHTDQIYQGPVRRPI